MFLKLLIASLTFTSILSQLTVLSPPALKSWWDKNPGSAGTSVATFGYIPWGRKIMGNLSLANPVDACDYIRQDNDAFAQHQILVVRRGGCPFVTKAHYAQLAGAKMVLIADTQYEEVSSHLMVDAMGQGDSVTIPTVLVDKLAGDKLIDSLNSTDRNISNVNVVFDFALKKFDKVEYHVWLSSASAQSFNFINNWRGYEQKLANYAKFVPHYAHYSAPGQEEHLKESPDCICGGKYCAPDPDDDRDNTGADVLIEDLRQMCLYKQDPNLWWSYMLHYDSFCLTGGDMNRCGQNALNDLKVNSEDIEKCIDNSFNTKNRNTCASNSIFDSEQKDANADAIYLFPSVIINGFAYRGTLTPPQGVFEAICETFNDMPGVCRHYLHIPATQGTSYAPVFISALIFLVLFSFFVFCCYRRYLKREMHRQMVKDVNIAVSQYIAFKDQNTSADREEDRTLDIK